MNNFIDTFDFENEIEIYTRQELVRRVNIYKLLYDSDRMKASKYRMRKLQHVVPKHNFIEGCVEFWYCGIFVYHSFT